MAPKETLTPQSPPIPDITPLQLAGLAAQLLPKISLPDEWLNADSARLEHAVTEASTGLPAAQMDPGYPVSYPAGWIVPWEVISAASVDLARKVLVLAGRHEVAALAVTLLPPLPWIPGWSAVDGPTLEARLKNGWPLNLDIVFKEAVKRAHILLNAASGIVRNELDEYQRADCEADEEMKQMMEDRESLGRIFDKRGGKDLSTGEALKAAWPEERPPKEHTLLEYWKLYLGYHEEDRKHEDRQVKLKKVEDDVENYRRRIRQLEEKIEKEPTPLKLNLLDEWNAELDRLMKEKDGIRESFKTSRWREYRPDFNRAQFMLEMAYFRKWLQGGGIEIIKGKLRKSNSSKGGKETQRKNAAKESKDTTVKPLSHREGKRIKRAAKEITGKDLKKKCREMNFPLATGIALVGTC